MKDLVKSCMAGDRGFRYGILMFFFSSLVCLAVFSGFTREKAQKSEVHKKNETVKTKNIGCEQEELNPLREGEHPELDKAVKDYYFKLEEDKAFIEKYDELHIYTKKGQYKDTYVVFVKYLMKIKDIYTEVPGLGTLYASKDEKSGGYLISTNKPEGQDQEYVRCLTEHEDVQKLFESTEEEYHAAVQSDALLKESLTDLKKAYTDSDG